MLVRRGTPFVDPAQAVNMTVFYKDFAADISELLVPDADATPIRAVKAADFPGNAKAHVSKAQAAWLKATEWRGKPGSHVLIPNEKGLVEVLFALGDEDASPANPLQLGGLPTALPEGTYKLVDFPGDPAQAVLAWLLGAYSFRRYLTS